MAQPLFQLLDRGQNPSTRSPGGHSEPITFCFSPNLEAVALPVCRVLREFSAPCVTTHALGMAGLHVGTLAWLRSCSKRCRAALGSPHLSCWPGAAPTGSQMGKGSTDGRTACTLRHSFETVLG